MFQFYILCNDQKLLVFCCFWEVLNGNIGQKWFNFSNELKIESLKKRIITTKQFQVNFSFLYHLKSRFSDVLESIENNINLRQVKWQTEMYNATYNTSRSQFSCRLQEQGKWYPFEMTTSYYQTATWWNLQSLGISIWLNIEGISISKLYHSNL